MNAASVAAYLRRAGFSPASPSDPNRAGIKCRNGWDGQTVYVSLDFDTAAERRSLADPVEAALRSRYAVTRAVTTADGTSFTVAERPPALPERPPMSGAHKADPDDLDVVGTPMTRARLRTVLRRQGVPVARSKYDGTGVHIVTFAYVLGISRGSVDAAQNDRIIAALEAEGIVWGMANMPVVRLAQ